VLTRQEEHAKLTPEMFQNLGSALRLLREQKKKSQAQLARETGVGKSQLSKYESGKELPKLDSLARLLVTLEVGYENFFSTLSSIDQALYSREAGTTLPSPALPSLGLEEADKAFSQVFKWLMVLHQACAANRLLLLPLEAEIENVV